MTTPRDQSNLIDDNTKRVTKAPPKSQNESLVHTKRDMIGQSDRKPLLDEQHFPPSDNIRRFNAEEIKQKLNNTILSQARRRKPPEKMS